MTARRKRMDGFLHCSAVASRREERKWMCGVQITRVKRVKRDIRAQNFSVDTVDVGIPNLGCHILPSQVASDTPTCCALYRDEI